MVKVYGPMMSLDASGTLGKAVTFSKWKGRNYVRERVIPSNPKSGGQTGRRVMFKFLTQAWSALTTGNKATWQDLADQLVALRFNAFVSRNMERWHNFNGPGQIEPVIGGDLASDDTLSAAVWEENRIKLSSEITTANQRWGTVIFADPDPAFVCAVGNAIMVVPHNAVQTYDEYWTPPTVQAWSFDMRPFSSQGVLSAETGDVTAAAP